MNARFHVWVNDGWVKLTLKPGQVLSHCVMYSTDEGWASEGETWRWDGKELHTTYVNDGRDCDGRLTRSSDGFTTEFVVNDEGYRVPDYQRVSGSQRDEYAEAAGY